MGPSFVVAEILDLAQVEHDLSHHAAGDDGLGSQLLGNDAGTDSPVSFGKLGVHSSWNFLYLFQYNSTAVHKSQRVPFPFSLACFSSC